MTQRGGKSQKHIEMRPVNEKSLFHFLCDAMEKVSTGEMDAGKATAICNLSREAEKLLEGERKRVSLLMKMDEHERNFNKRPQLRELAAFGFANTTVDQQTGSPRNDDGSYLK